MPIQNFELYDSVLSYGAGFVLGLAAGVVMLCLACYKRINLWTVCAWKSIHLLFLFQFDLFSDKHRDEFTFDPQKSTKTLRKTSCGGCLAVMMIPLVLTVMGMKISDLFCVLLCELDAM
jgi:hypothetical protein